LIGEIGAEVLRQACQTVQGWRRTVPGYEHLAVAVNVSGWQILTPDYSLQVADTLAQTGLPAGALTLEITESMLLEDSETLGAELDRIRALNVRIAMDDFGAGYSSLRYLKRLPFDFVKLDRGLLEGVERDPAALALADACLGLLSRLGLRGVAEGIETPAQLHVVESLGCRYGQGFLFGTPLLPADVPALLTGDGGRVAVPAPRAERASAHAPA
jgi:EAL domain-containing protein (putative c-di-GMP-specific phosphodiesterase class I)